MSHFFFLAATSRIPQVLFDTTTQSALLEGECYPEDADKFFGIMSQVIEDYFATGLNDLNMEIKLIYFNSSSARGLMEMMDSLEALSSQGKAIRVNWFYDEDDDFTKEFIEDVVSDHSALKISMMPIADS
jgi:hypothetical protein